VVNIKEKIGQRILEARKAKGFTRKALADLTDDLKQSRINNWERGIRTPGPEEIKQLAQALEVSPAFLMCLSDEKKDKLIANPSRLIPLLDYKQAYDTRAAYEQEFRDIVFISVSTVLLPELSEEAFAIKIIDDSMIPEIRVNDTLVIDPSVSPKPGDYVIVKIGNKSEIIICQYKKLSYTSSDFELLTLNDNWPNIRVCHELQVEIIGVVMQNIRGY
jgi:SOS-response transcriptional repressor LexA